MILKIVADAGMSAVTPMPCARSSSAGPSPESCISCGELNAPPARMTSPLARAARVVPPCRYSTPTARRPSNRMRLASALVSTTRLDRRRASPQIADRGRPAPAILRRELEIAGALLRRPVEIVVARIARLLRGVDERLAQRMRLADVGDGERPADAVQRVLAPLLVLGAAEVRQHIVEAPAGIAELPPMIVIRRLAAQIKQAVDRARPAQDLASRLDHLTVVELGLRLRLVEPVDPAVGEQLAVAERDMNPEMTIMAARFQQENAMAARRGQAVGQHAAGGTGADDDVIERVCVGHGCHNGYSILASGKVQRQIERGLGRGEQIR